jgi:hypothetical protein
MDFLRHSPSPNEAPPPGIPTVSGIPTVLQGFSGSLCAFFLSAGLFLEPVYVFASGLPQPSDFLFCLALLAGFVGMIESFTSLDRLFLITLGILNLWFYTVSAWWTARLGVVDVYNFLFIPFNSLVCWMVASLVRARPEANRYFAIAALASLLIQAGYILLWRSDDFREAGTTTNPNQLAYWAVSALVLLLYTTRYNRYSLLHALVAIPSTILILFLTVSRAGAASIIPFLVLWICTRTRRAIVALVTFMGVALLLVSMQSNILTDHWRHRLSDPQEVAEGGFWSRGYQRIIDYPQYVLFGASELRPDRFDHVPMPQEVHSTFGNVLFSYGVIGLCTFLTLLFAAIRAAPLERALYLTPAMMFGLYHYGLRATSFWILLGLFVGQESVRRDRQAATPAHGLREMQRT